MAKVRNTNDRANAKKVNEEVTTSKTKPRGKSKTPNTTSKTRAKTSTQGKAANKNPPKKGATKRSNADCDIDSGISSPERPKQTQTTDKKKAKTTRISDKSKKAISKARKTPVISNVKQMTDISWMRGLIQENVVSHPKLKRLMGIEIRYPSSLTLRKENEVDYLMYPWSKNVCSGFIRMVPGSKKRLSQSGSTVHFFVLLGKVELLAASSYTEFKEGAMITVPRGVRYGLVNKTKENTFLRFQVLGGHD